MEEEQESLDQYLSVIDTAVVEEGIESTFSETGRSEVVLVVVVMVAEVVSISVADLLLLEADAGSVADVFDPPVTEASILWTTGEVGCCSPLTWRTIPIFYVSSRMQMLPDPPQSSCPSHHQTIPNHHPQSCVNDR